MSVIWPIIGSKAKDAMAAIEISLDHMAMLQIVLET